MLFSIVWSFFATFFYGVENTAAGEVTLLDSSQFTELNWKTYSLDNDTSEHGWQEESLPLAEHDVNSRSYVTCDVRRSFVDNWLQLPLIRLDNRPTKDGYQASNRLWIDIAFTSRDCRQLKKERGEQDAQSCKESFGLYYYETDSAVDFTAIIRDKNNQIFRPIGQIAADAGRFTGRHDVAIHREVRSVQLTKKGVYFAFRDEGTCVSILRVKIFYLVCNEIFLNFARFPPTAVGPDLTSIVKVKGQCVSHSTSDVVLRSSNYNGGADNRPQQICKADGQWDLLSGVCQCLPGYMSEGQSACIPCPTNTFKEALGFGTCQTCPPASHAPSNGSSYCQCIPGYYRLHDDSKSSPCTTLPSKPLNFKIDRLSENDVQLSWIEPKSRGGRRELWYKFECRTCPSTAIFEPSNLKRLNSTQIRVSNLTPGNSYVVRLTAENDLSIQQTSSLSSNDFDTEILNFTMDRRTSTKISNLSSQSLDVKLDHVTEDRVVLTWRKTTLDENTVYQIRYKPIFTDLRFGKADVDNDYAYCFVDNKTSAVVENLSDGRDYVFQVRQLLHGDAWSPWSSKLITKTNLAKPADRPYQKLDFAISPFIYTIVLPVFGAVFFTMSILVYFYWPSKTKRRKFRCLNTNPHMEYKKYMLEVGNSTIESRESQNTIRQPLRPCFGPPVVPPLVHFAHEFVPYVDPSTYENPENVLHHFAPKIHPSRVQVLETIGEGEFGDVCRGILLLDRPDRTSGDYSVVDDSVSTIHYQSSSQIMAPSTGNYEQPPSANRQELLRLVVAVKILKNETFCAKARRNFLSEAFIMGQFRHTNVVRLIGVVNHFDQPAMIVIEYMQNGSLNNFLKDKEKILGPLQLVTMLAGIARGMKYLTEKGYLHRDLAARNVLVDLNLTCKIADFGLSRCTDRTDQTYVTNGGKIPVRWTAPEAIILRQFTVSSDVWSFGVCSWEVMSYGKRPYGAWTNQQVLEQVQNGYRLTKPQNCPDCIYNLMLMCWADKRHERPDFARICRNLNEILN